MQVVKTAKNIKAAQHEQSAGDAERHQGTAISNDLLRIVQLVARHWFAFAHFLHNRFGAADFFADRKSCSVVPSGSRIQPQRRQAPTPAREMMVR